MARHNHTLRTLQYKCVLKRCVQALAESSETTLHVWGQWPVLRCFCTIRRSGLGALRRLPIPSHPCIRLRNRENFICCQGRFDLPGALLPPHPRNSSSSTGTRLKAAGKRRTGVPGGAKGCTSAIFQLPVRSLLLCPRGIDRPCEEVDVLYKKPRVSVTSGRWHGVVRCVAKPFALSLHFTIGM